MKLIQQYEELAKQLGDVVFKLEVLQRKRKELVQQIERLDALAGMINAETKTAKTQGNTVGDDSST